MSFTFVLGSAPQLSPAQDNTLPPISNKPRAASQSATSTKPTTKKPTAKKPTSANNAAASQKPKPKAKPATRRAPAQPDAPGVPRSVTNWPTGRKLIALTYDDGPNPKFTPQFIALLEKEQVKATFYVMGSAVKANPTLTKSMAVHPLVELANHSYSHPALSRISAEKARNELVSTEQILKATVGRGTTHMRPPYGAENATVRRICHELGLRVILWDVDTNDWRNVTADQIADTILKQTTDGSIILMHDRLQRSLDASAKVIPELKRRGFEFVFVSELLAQPRAGGGGAATQPLAKPVMSLPSEKELPAPPTAREEAPVAVPRTSAPQPTERSESRSSTAVHDSGTDDSGLPVPANLVRQ